MSWREDGYNDLIHCVKESMLELSEQGYSGRGNAELLKLSSSTVHRCLKRIKQCKYSENIKESKCVGEKKDK